MLILYGKENLKFILIHQSIQNMCAEEFISVNLQYTNLQFCYIYTPSEIIRQCFLGIIETSNIMMGLTTEYIKMDTDRIDPN